MLKPPENLTVSEWADKYRMLTEKETNFPGPWRTDRVPYLKGIMDAISDVDIEEIVFCKPTQVGGTEFLYNALGYIIMQDPSPCMLVYPSEDLAEFASKNRIQAMIKNVGGMRERYMESDSKLLELQFTGMYLVLSGANSASSLASRPIRILLLDEVDKYPLACGKEADPISLAKERTKTYRFNKKILLASTPTVETGPIWVGYEAADERRKYHVPCPHCGHKQPFEFKQIKWEKGCRDASVAQQSAWYECVSCKGVIRDNHKMSMLLQGEWIGDRQDDSMPVRKVAFHLNAIYSPWVTFGDVAAEFLNSRPFPLKFQNFINSWLGEPYRNTETQANPTDLAKNQHNSERGVVPDGTQLLTVAVDVQLDHFWFEMAAWSPYITKKLVDYGRVETWGELENLIIHRRYHDETGNPYIVNLALIDSGFRTDEVYEFCSRFPEVCRPCKGSSKRMNTPYSVNSIDKDGYGGLKLIMVDGHYYKDVIHSRMKRDPSEPGSWSLFRGCPQEYVDHITAEQKVLVQDRKTGKITEEWQKIASGVDNHMLDCAVYNAACAELAQVRYLVPENQLQPRTSEMVQPEPQIIEELPQETAPQQEIPAVGWRQAAEMAIQEEEQRTIGDDWFSRSTKNWF